MRFSLILFIFLLSACGGKVVKQTADSRLVNLSKMAWYKASDHSWLVPFERAEIEYKLQEKIDQEIPLVVHALVPLCDNTHQGIFPTTESLGDGFNLKTNLYWATRHGMKRYFLESPHWENKAIYFQATDTILERVVFTRKFENNANVILICDAYRGDQMRSCVSDYFHFLAGKKTDSVLLGDQYFQCGQNADMIVFNGHNGMYEAALEPIFTVNKRQKDAVAIACSSYWNFTEQMQNANCYPLVTTTESMYPGATVLDKIIEKWAMLENAEQIRQAAANGYNEMKNCGAEPSDRIFYSGF